MRFWVIRHGVIPASRGGKMKTLAQGMAVGMYVLALTGPLATLRCWVMAVAVVLTVVTGLDYVRQAIVLRAGRGVRGERAARRRRRGRERSERRLRCGRRGAGLLAERGETLAVAESLTGGLVAARAHRGARRLAGLPRLGHGVRDRPQAATCSAWTAPCWRSAERWTRGRAADGGGRTARCWAPTGASPPPGVAGPDPQDGQPVGHGLRGGRRGRAAPGKWPRCG